MYGEYTAENYDLEGYNGVFSIELTQEMIDKALVKQ